MSNYLKYNISEAKKSGFLTYFNENVSEHKKLKEILNKYYFSSLAFKNGSFICCNKNKCVELDSVKFDKIDRYVVNAIVYDLVLQYYSDVSKSEIVMKYDTKMLDSIHDSLNNWRVLENKKDYSVFLSDDADYLSVNLYQKWTEFKSYSLEFDSEAKELVSLKAGIDSFIKKQEKNTSKSQITSGLILKWGDSLFFGCSCVGWASEHAILIQKADFDWEKYVTITPYFNAMVINDRIIDSILLSKEQVKELKEFLFK